MDEGWTRWTLEQHEFPFTTIHPEDLRKDGGAKAFDCIIFPDTGASQILRGLAGPNIPEEYRGGIEDAGVKGLEAFIKAGGTVIAMGQSANLLMDKLGAPVRNSVQGVGRDAFFCPGSIVRVTVDTAHPVAYGMTTEANAYFSNSMVLEPVPSFAGMDISFIALYPQKDVLRSGWLQGEAHMAGKAAAVEVRLGKGRMILLPFKVLNRAQAYGTFKFLFNAILTSAAK